MRILARIWWGLVGERSTGHGFPDLSGSMNLAPTKTCVTIRLVYLRSQ